MKIIFTEEDIKTILAHHVRYNISGVDLRQGMKIEWSKDNGKIVFTAETPVFYDLDRYLDEPGDNKLVDIGNPVRSEIHHEKPDPELDEDETEADDVSEEVEEQPRKRRRRRTKAEMEAARAAEASRLEPVTQAILEAVTSEEEEDEDEPVKEVTEVADHQTEADQLDIEDFIADSSTSEAPSRPRSLFAEMDNSAPKLVETGSNQILLDEEKPAVPAPTKPAKSLFGDLTSPS